MSEPPPAPLDGAGRPHHGRGGVPPRLRRAAGRAARYEPPPGLRRGVGSPELFGIVQAFVAATVYFAMGLVAERAQGLTWLVFVGAALFFVLLVLSYVEGASLHQERGGATVIARYAFNEFWSFVAGWAILLDYLMLVAITALVATHYAAVVWSPLDEGPLQFVLATVLLGIVAWLNVRGGGERRYSLFAYVVLADLALQVAIIVAGLALLWEPRALSAPTQLGRGASASDFLFASTLAIVAFAGLDASSGLAGQVKIGRRGLRRLIGVRVAAAVIPLVGVSLLAVSALELGRLPDDPEAVHRPMVAIVEGFDQGWLREPLRYVVALSAMLILGAACNAAMLGLSRLGYSLSLNRQIPSGIGRLHPRYATPWVVIAVGTLLAVVLLVPADLEFLAGIYATGATLAFTLVHLAIITLRRREPARDRPYKMPLNLRVGGTEWPLPAMLGFAMSAVAFVSVLTLHAGARTVGVTWMLGGVLFYVVYRIGSDKPLTKRVVVPEASLTRRAPAAQYGSILVPVLGTPLDDDIMQTAGRLAAEEGLEEGEGGAVIEALWVFEIPMMMPLHAPIPEDQLKHARRSLARAKAVGEEYAGVEVATATARGRRAGETIVHEARRRGVEAIVLAAEEPTRLRGGALLGGKQGLRDTYVGETTKYVVQKAPCRVILTAPPAAAAEHPAAAHDPTRLGYKQAAPGAPAPVPSDGAAGGGGDPDRPAALSSRRAVAPTAQPGGEAR